MNGRIALISGLLLLLTAGMAVRAEDSAPAKSAEELETQIQKILDDARIPGMIGAIVYGDDIVWQGALGVADIEIGHPVSEETLFRLGSISKMFVSLAVLRLAERGELRLSDTIETLAPESGVVNPWASTHPVRLVHLLEHTAGLPDAGLRGNALNDPTVTTRRGIELSATSLGILWRPGTRMAYSNIGPPIAALALENLTGQPFEEFVEREVFDPLGMKTATFYYNDNVASSYNAAGDKKPYRHLLRPGGGASASSSDMIHLLRMFNRCGMIETTTFLKPTSIARMETPATTLAAEAGLRVGFGLGNYTTQRDGFVYQGHGGGVTGFISRLAYLPQTGRGYFISINARHVAAFDAIDREIRVFVTKDLVPPKRAKAVDVPESQLRALTGTYLPDSVNFPLSAGIQRLQIRTVRYQDGSLYLDPFASAGIELCPAGDNQFITGDDPMPSHMFVMSPDGEQLLQAEDHTLRRVSPWVAWAPLIATAASISVSLTTLLFAPIWCVRKVLGRLKGVRHLSVRILPVIAAVMLIVMAMLFIGAPGIDALARPTMWSVGFWISSLLFTVLSGLSLLNAILHFAKRREVGRIIWYHSLLASVALLTLTALLANAGLIGLRTWTS